MRVIMYVCPTCAKVRKHGQWLHLEAHEMRDINAQVLSGKIIVDTAYFNCPPCEEKLAYEPHMVLGECGFVPV